MTKKTRGRSRHRTPGDLFIVSAPSGAGKTTLCRKLCRSMPSLKTSISYTTREPRKNEARNADYHFISKDRFISMVRRGEFAEWAVVHGNYYGTAKKDLRALSGKGYDVLLDIDVQGAAQLKRAFPVAVTIFILPPSLKVLKERLTGRRTDNADVIRKRLENARKELEHYDKYDYIVCNDDLKKAVKDMESIIISRKLMIEKVDSRLIKLLK